MNSFQVLQPTILNMGTSAGSPTRTPPTTPGSFLLYLKTALSRRGLKVRPARLSADPTLVLQRATNIPPSAGKLVLPDVKVLTERFFKRQKFRPDPQGTNLMFAFMAQHFTHQFFKTSHKAKGGFTKALGHGVRHTGVHPKAVCNRHLPCRSHRKGQMNVLDFVFCPIQVDASNIYGEDLERQHQLRLHEDGKLKYQVKKRLKS